MAFGVGRFAALPLCRFAALPLCLSLDCCLDCCLDCSAGEGLGAKMAKDCQRWPRGIRRPAPIQVHAHSRAPTTLVVSTSNERRRSARAYNTVQ